MNMKNHFVQEGSSMVTDTRLRAFTIIELILAASLLLMIATVTISGYNRTYESELYVKKFVSDIRYVYHKNGFGDIDCQISYIYESPLDSQKILGYYIIEDSRAKNKRILPEYLKLTPSHKNNIRFTQSGSLTFSGETINFTDSQNNDRYRVTIVPTSGRVMVYKNE